LGGDLLSALSFEVNFPQAELCDPGVGEKRNSEVTIRVFTAQVIHVLVQQRLNHKMHSSVRSVAEVGEQDIQHLVTLTATQVYPKS